MCRHPLYTEFEKENYLFERLIRAGQHLLKVVNLANLDDFCEVNPLMTVNGQLQAIKGPECTDKTIQMLQRFLTEINRCNGEFIDYDYTIESEGV